MKYDLLRQLMRIRRRDSETNRRRHFNVVIIDGFDDEAMADVIREVAPTTRFLQHNQPRRFVTPHHPFWRWTAKDVSRFGRAMH